jgi:hypothetical protein
MFFVLLLTYLLSVFGDNNAVYTKYQLRGMFEKEKNKLIQYFIVKEYENIYNGVLHQAKIGNTELQFTILCDVNQEKHKLHIKSVLFNNGIREHDGILDDLIRRIPETEINTEKVLISSKIIDKLQMSFPDSNIIWETDNDIMFNPMKCIFYTMSW